MNARGGVLVVEGKKEGGWEHKEEVLPGSPYLPPSLSLHHFPPSYDPSLPVLLIVILSCIYDK